MIGSHIPITRAIQINTQTHNGSSRSGSLVRKSAMGITTRVINSTYTTLETTNRALSTASSIEKPQPAKTKTQKIASTYCARMSDVLQKLRKVMKAECRDSRFGQLATFGCLPSAGRPIKLPHRDLPADCVLIVLQQRLRLREIHHSLAEPVCNGFSGREECAMKLSSGLGGEFRLDQSALRVL